MKKITCVMMFALSQCAWQPAEAQYADPRNYYQSQQNYGVRSWRGARSPYETYGGGGYGGYGGYGGGYYWGGGENYRPYYAPRQWGGGSYYGGYPQGGWNR